MPQPKGSTFTDMLPEMDAGVFDQKINRALSDVALGCVTTGKVGQVQITLDMKQIANSNQVTLSHKIKFVKPTPNGKLTEENTTETPMHVGPGGKLTLFPDTQEKIDFEALSRTAE